MFPGWGTLPRIARFLIAGSVSLVVVAVVLMAVVFLAPALGSVGPGALYWSVSREVRGTQLLGSDGCKKRRSSRWTCEIKDSSGSGAAVYEVVLRGDCWHAKRAPGEVSFEGSMAVRANGCVRLRDQARLLDRALN